MTDHNDIINESIQKNTPIQPDGIQEAWDPFPPDSKGAEEPDYKTVRSDETNFPKRLSFCPAMPSLLYYKGTLPSDGQSSVSIVGSRSCSPYGKTQAFRFAKRFAESGVAVISGLAAGIDTCAHKGALAGGGLTYAVMGCGIDICYPAGNYPLYEEILKTGGGILSEFEPGMPPLAYHFPTRNRIVSALGDVVLVIEARQKSGSLITAQHGLEQGKTIYALPGRIDDLTSFGCNALIAEGASPAISPEQILRDLGIGPAEGEDLQAQKRAKKKALAGLDANAEAVYDCLSSDPLTIDGLLELLPLKLPLLMPVLLQLELADLVYEPSPGLYCRTCR